MSNGRVFPLSWTLVLLSPRRSTVTRRPARGLVLAALLEPQHNRRNPTRSLARLLDAYRNNTPVRCLRVLVIHLYQRCNENALDSVSLLKTLFFFTPTYRGLENSWLGSATRRRCRLTARWPSSPLDPTSTTSFVGRVRDEAVHFERCA